MICQGIRQFVSRQSKFIKTNNLLGKNFVKIRNCLPILSLFALTGCGGFYHILDLVCIGGICNSKEESLSEIKWQPEKLNNMSCPSLNGKYQARTTDYLLEGVLEVGFKNWREDKKTRLNNIQVISTFTANKIPWVRQSNGAETDDDFYKNAAISLFIDQTSLTATLTGEDGLDYKKTIISFDGSMVGCHDEMFIIRKSNAIGGREGALGNAYAAETLLTSLPDGTLKVAINRRGWRYGWALGLVGDLDTGILDRQKTETHLFPLVNTPAEPLPRIH